MSSLRKMVVVVGAEQHFALVANFVVAILTSRILAPDEIGIALIGTAVLTLAVALREYAAPSFLIKNANLTREQLSGVLTGMLCVNALLVVSLAVAAPLIGRLYSDVRLVPYLRVVALGLMLEAFTLPVVATLRREMAVDRAAIIGVTGASVMTIATVGFAAAGWGYMSFCWGFLAGTSSGALAGTIVKPGFWLFKPTLNSWRALFLFGSSSGTSALLRQLYESVPYLILGHILPVEMVAYYHRALMLSQLPGKLLLNSVETIMLPHFSQELRQGSNLKATFLRALECVTVVYWPALFMLAILAHPIVRVLYGPAWLDAVPLLQIMALASMFSFLGKLDVSVLVATGGLRDLLWSSLIVFPVSAVISTTAASFGLHSLALSYWLIYPLQLAISLTFIRRHIDFGLVEFVGGLSKSFVIALVSCLAPLAIVSVLGASQLALMSTLLIGSCAILGWLIAMWITQHAMLAEVTQGHR